MTVAVTTPAAAARIRAYVELTKPRITLLVLLTAYAGMAAAAGGTPAPLLTLWTLLGTGLAAASSSTLNNVIDRDIDRLMARTRRRALPSGAVAAPAAATLGLTLGVAAFVVLAAGVNLLAALLAVATIFAYVAVYTLWLKRTTPLCTAIGGIPGAAPPLIGWAAVRGDLGVPALVLFAVMFLWQPPHFWALALARADEYRAAGIPMLPVVKSARATKRHMLAWMLALLPASLLPTALGFAGVGYAAVAATAGAVYLGETLAFARRAVTPAGAKRLFLLSIAYLTLLSLALVADFRPGAW